MDISISCEECFQYYLVSVRGKCMVGTASEVRRALEGALNRGSRVIVLDLNKTTVMDTAGVGVISAVHKLLVASKGQLHFLSPGYAILCLLQSAGMLAQSRVFKSRDELDRALKCGLDIRDRGYYVHFTFPEQFNIEIVKPLRDSIDSFIQKGKHSLGRVDIRSS